MNYDLLCETLSFTKDNEVYVKKVDEYLFSIVKTVDNQYVLVSILDYTFDNNNEIFNNIKDNYKIKFNSTIKPSDTLLIKINGKTETEAAEFCASAIKELVQWFNENNIMPNYKCLFCGERSDEAINVKGYYVYSHTECKEKFKEQAMDEINSKENTNVSSNPVLSIILSLVFVVLSIIIVKILEILTETYFSIAYALPPFAAYFGYKLGKAKIDSKAKILFGVFSFVGTIVSYAFDIYLYKMAYPEFTYAEILMSDIGSALFILVSYIFGMVFLNRYISKNDRIKKEINKL